MAKALVEACDAEQVALHEPLLTMLLDATTTRRSSPRMADNQDGQADATYLDCSDDVGYRTYTFGGTVTEGTVVALRYVHSMQLAHQIDTCCL